MRHVSGRVEPMRVVALESTPEPCRARVDLLQSFALLMGAMAILVTVVAFLVMSHGAALSPSNRSAGRWLLGALGLVTGALAYSSGKLFLSRSEQLPRRKLRIDARAITFKGPGNTEDLLLDFARPFGATLLGNRARTRLVLAVTTAQRTIYFASHVEPSLRFEHRALLSSASTVSDDDAVLDATGPDGKPFDLRVRDLSDLVSLLLRADRNAFDRCFLSDTHGAAIVLDGAELRIGRKDFDLRAPLEWRATVFQEPFTLLVAMSDRDSIPQTSGGVMVYQATWVRQGMSEAVLVSLVASVSTASASPHHPIGEMPEIASAVLRDVRLMQATPDAPPPTELRVGIERVYMLRLRAALDRAPRASHRDVPSGASAR